MDKQLANTICVFWWDIGQGVGGEVWGRGWYQVTNQRALSRDLANQQDNAAASWTLMIAASSDVPVPTNSPSLALTWLAQHFGKTLSLL